MEPVGALATLVTLAVIVQKGVEAVRRRYPNLDGGHVQAVAVAAGVAIASGIDLRATVDLLDALGVSVGNTPAPWLDYVITGVAVGAGSGFLADLTGRSGVRYWREVEPPADPPA